MAKKKQKLELTWIGKDEEVKLEPRILIEDPAKSYGDPESENMLIHGDNLLALKALEQDFAGKIKCIYIDPPYNIDAATDHYDDNLEHSEWLSLMKPRLELLHSLLAPDGILAVQIDDYEFAKLYLLIAEVFNSEKKLKTIAIKMSEPTGVKMASVNATGTIPKLKEFIILAGKNGVRNLTIEKIPKDKWDYEYKTVCLGCLEEELEDIKNVMEDEQRTESDIVRIEGLLEKLSFSNINDVCREEIGQSPTEEWLHSNAYRIIQFATLTGGAKDSAVEKKLNYNEVPSAFTVTTARGKMYIIKGEFNHETRLPRCKFLFADKYLEVHPGDFWSDIKTTGLDNEGVVEFPNGKKPERLLYRIISMCTQKGDYVLDSFLGSGSTVAVAHKLNRRWIGVELGEHANTHCVPRLKAVVDGSDQGGVSNKAGWKGGGGFKFYNLAPSLLHKDVFGNWMIEEKYNPNMLAHAVCKHEGFAFRPDEEMYWKQGRSTETDFIFVTTKYITVEQLDRIHGEMKEDESLLICAKSYAPECEDKYVNITIKKIPQTILGKCEFNKENYDLNIIESTEEVAEEQSNHENDYE